MEKKEKTDESEVGVESQQIQQQQVHLALPAPSLLPGAGQSVGPLVPELPLLLSLSNGSSSSSSNTREMTSGGE